MLHKPAAAYLTRRSRWLSAVNLQSASPLGLAQAANQEQPALEHFGSLPMLAATAAPQHKSLVLAPPPKRHPAEEQPPQRGSVQGPDVVTRQEPNTPQPGEHGRPVRTHRRVASQPNEHPHPLRPPSSSLVAAQLLLSGIQDPAQLQAPLQELTLRGHAHTLAACARAQVSISKEVAVLWSDAIIACLSTSILSPGTTQQPLAQGPGLAAAGGAAGTPGPQSPPASPSQQVFRALGSLAEPAIVILTSLASRHKGSAFTDACFSALLLVLQPVLPRLPPPHIIRVLRALALMDRFPSTSAAPEPLKQTVAGLMYRPADVVGGTASQGPGGGVVQQEAKGNVMSSRGRLTSWLSTCLSAIRPHHLELLSSRQRLHLLSSLARFDTSAEATTWDHLGAEAHLVQAVAAHAEWQAELFELLPLGSAAAVGPSQQAQKDGASGSTSVPPPPPPLPSPPAQAEAEAAGVAPAEADPGADRDQQFGTSPGPAGLPHPWSLRHAVWALSRFNIPIKQHWLPVMSEAAGRWADSLSLVTLSLMLQVFAGYRYTPSTGHMDRIWEAVGTRLDQESTHSCSQLLLAAVKLGEQPPPGLIRAALAKAAGTLASARVTRAVLGSSNRRREVSRGEPQPEGSQGAGSVANSDGSGTNRSPLVGSLQHPEQGGGTAQVPRPVSIVHLLSVAISTQTHISPDMAPPLMHSVAWGVLHTARAVKAWQLQHRRSVHIQMRGQSTQPAYTPQAVAAALWVLANIGVPSSAATASPNASGSGAADLTTPLSAVPGVIQALEWALPQLMRSGYLVPSLSPTEAAELAGSVAALGLALPEGALLPLLAHAAQSASALPASVAARLLYAISKEPGAADSLFNVVKRAPAAGSHWMDIYVALPVLLRKVASLPPSRLAHASPVMLIDVLWAVSKLKLPQLARVVCQGTGGATPQRQQHGGAAVEGEAAGTSPSAAASQLAPVDNSAGAVESHGGRAAAHGSCSTTGLPEAKPQWLAAARQLSRWAAGAEAALASSPHLTQLQPPVLLRLLQASAHLQLRVPAPALHTLLSHLACMPVPVPQAAAGSGHTDDEGGHQQSSSCLQPQVDTTSPSPHISVGAAVSGALTAVQPACDSPGPFSAQQVAQDPLSPPIRSPGEHQQQPKAAPVETVVEILWLLRQLGLSLPADALVAMAASVDQGWELLKPKDVARAVLALADLGLQLTSGGAGDESGASPRSSGLLDKVRPHRLLNALAAVSPTQVVGATAAAAARGWVPAAEHVANNSAANQEHSLGDDDQMLASRWLAEYVLPNLTADQLASLLLGAAKFQAPLKCRSINSYLELYKELANGRASMLGIQRCVTALQLLQHRPSKAWVATMCQQVSRMLMKGALSADEAAQLTTSIQHLLSPQPSPAMTPAFSGQGAMAPTTLSDASGSCDIPRAPSSTPTTQQQQQHQQSGPAAPRLSPEPEHVQATSRVLRHLLMARLQSSFRKLTVSLLMGAEGDTGPAGAGGEAATQPGRDPGPDTLQDVSGSHHMGAQASSTVNEVHAEAHQAGDVLQTDASSAHAVKGDDAQQGSSAVTVREQPTAVLNAVLHAQLLRTLMSIAYQKPQQSPHHHHPGAHA